MAATPQVIATAAAGVTEIIRGVFTMGIDIADRLAENVDARVNRKITARLARIEIRRQRRLMRAETRDRRRERKRGK